MRLNKRFITTLATAFLSQAVLCPTACLAGSSEQATTTHAGADALPQAHASSGAEHPCHQSPPGAPESESGNRDTPASCTSCSAEAPLTYAAEGVSHSPCLAVASSPLVTPIELTTDLDTPFGPNHGPPPARLYLLKSSFLI
jgi:hypothetical protein